MLDTIQFTLQQPKKSDNRDYGTDTILDPLTLKTIYPLLLAILKEDMEGILVG